MSIVWGKGLKYDQGYPFQQMLSERQRQLLRQLDSPGTDAKIDRRTKKYKRANMADLAGEKRIGPA